MINCRTATYHWILFLIARIDWDEYSMNWVFETRDLVSHAYKARENYPTCFVRDRRTPKSFSTADRYQRDGWKPTLAFIDFLYLVFSFPWTKSMNSVEQACDPRRLVRRKIMLFFARHYFYLIDDGIFTARSTTHWSDERENCTVNVFGSNLHFSFYVEKLEHMQTEHWSTIQSLTTNTLITDPAHSRASGLVDKQSGEPRDNLSLRMTCYRQNKPQALVDFKRWQINERN